MSLVLLESLPSQMNLLTWLLSRASIGMWQWVIPRWAIFRSFVGQNAIYCSFFVIICHM